MSHRANLVRGQEHVLDPSPEVFENLTTGEAVIYSERMSFLETPHARIGIPLIPETPDLKLPAPWIHIPEIPETAFRRLAGHNTVFTVHADQAPLFFGRWRINSSRGTS